MKTKPSIQRGGIGTEKEFDAKKLIGIDQPFNYSEVVSITGSEYVRNLQRDEISSAPYEELKERATGFYLLDNQCIWMKAGIINFRICDQDYDCYNCSFDLRMRDAMGKANQQKVAQPAPAETPGGFPGQVMNPCIYSLRGHPDAPSECIMDYACVECAVHQSKGKKTELLPHPLERPKTRVVSGYELAEGYYFHFGHTWIHIVHGECVRVGIDDFAARVFGRPNALNLPKEGSSLRQGDIGWVLSRGIHQAPMKSPLSGRILSVNRKVIENPKTIHDDPFHDGWLFHLEPAFLKQECESLYSGNASVEWMERETKKLMTLLGPEYERLSSTGGRALDDLYGSCEDIGWNHLVRIFLHT